LLTLTALFRGTDLVVTAHRPAVNKKDLVQPCLAGRRQRRAAVTLASLKTLGHSPKARLVVTMIELRS
jgi:hypothetical protein